MLGGRNIWECTGTRNAGESENELDGSNSPSKLNLENMEIASAHLLIEISCS
jgi:hypothetical protein